MACWLIGMMADGHDGGWLWWLNAMMAKSDRERGFDDRGTDRWTDISNSRVVFVTENAK